jgi:hypothetical protein
MEGRVLARLPYYWCKVLRGGVVLSWQGKQSPFCMLFCVLQLCLSLVGLSHGTGDRSTVLSLFVFPFRLFSSYPPFPITEGFFPQHIRSISSYSVFPTLVRFPPLREVSIDCNWCPPFPLFLFCNVGRPDRAVDIPGRTHWISMLLFLGCSWTWGFVAVLSRLSFTVCIGSEAVWIGGWIDTSTLGLLRRTMLSCGLGSGRIVWSVVCCRIWCKFSSC